MSNFNAYDLFDNPMVRSAKESMSSEEIERYKIIGEKFYESINFENSQILDTTPIEQMKDAVEYVKVQLRSGIHPSMLDEDEKVLLEDAYGVEWYKKWGYVKEDLKDILTIKNIGER